MSTKPPYQPRIIRGIRVATPQEAAKVLRKKPEVYHPLKGGPRPPGPVRPLVPPPKKAPVA
jgi:hypothetical protein